MHNLYILVQLIECFVETSDYATAVGILVPDVDRSYF